MIFRTKEQSLFIRARLLWMKGHDEKNTSWEQEGATEQAKDAEAGGTGASKRSLSGRRVTGKSGTGRQAIRVGWRPHCQYRTRESGKRPDYDPQGQCLRTSSDSSHTSDSAAPETNCHHHTRRIHI